MYRSVRGRDGAERRVSLKNCSLVGGRGSWRWGQEQLRTEDVSGENIDHEGRDKEQRRTRRSKGRCLWVGVRGKLYVSSGEDILS